jgi:hypothetical protein
LLERSILFLKGDYWIIRDKISSTDDHRGDVWFHFDSSGKSGLNILCFGRDGRWVEEDRWISHCYGQKEPAKACAYSVLFKNGDEVFSFLLPQTSETAWQVKEIPTEDGRAFEVNGGKTRDLVMIRGDEWRWVRSSGDEVEEVVTLP